MVFHPCHHPLEIATRFPQFHSPDDDDSLLSPRGHFYWGCDSNGAKSNAKVCWTWSDQAVSGLKGSLK